MSHKTDNRELGIFFATTEGRRGGGGFKGRMPTFFLSTMFPIAGIFYIFQHTFLFGEAYTYNTISLNQPFSSFHVKFRRKTLQRHCNVHELRTTTKGGSLHALSTSWTGQWGDSALEQVETMAGRIAQTKDSDVVELNGSPLPTNVAGTGANVFDPEVNGIENYTSNEKSRRKRLLQNTQRFSSQKQIWTALSNLERDMQLLDTIAGEKPQLSTLEFSLLSLSVLAAATSPFMFNLETAELIGPASAAFSAAIGIGAEYVGKVAVADGKEVAAAAMICAAEAEGLLANAERAKAVCPLCVGIGATAASFALLAPSLISALGITDNLQLITELYLLCPLVSVLAAAVSCLAVQETRSFAYRAVSNGNRRFAKSGFVGRTWLSATEQIERKSSNADKKWKSFSFAVLPAPIVGALVPGALGTKAIVVAALAAAQSAYYLAQTEYILSRAMDAVALKSRSAAVCDTYANQGARSAAILPFTSALSSLCAAATAAIVELPFLQTFATLGGIQGAVGQIGLLGVFPTASALFAAAASVSKARCEVDAEAATQAASTLALEYESSQDLSDDNKDPVLNPFSGVKELLQLVVSSSMYDPFKKKIQHNWVWLKRLTKKFIKFFRRKNSRNDTKVNVEGKQATALTPAIAAA